MNESGRVSCCEPMEIDLSSSSSEVLSTRSEEDPECDTTDFRQTILPQTLALETPLLDATEKSGVKVYHIKFNHKKRISGFSRSRSPVWVLLSALFILCVSISVYHIGILKCSEKIDLLHLKQTLSVNLYGQLEAIESIMDTLNTDTKIKVLFLSGGTGVGKTYTTSMIMEKVWNSSNVYHYTMPGFVNTFSADFLLGLTICKDALFIVDDITPNDDIKSHVKQLVDKSRNLGNNLTMMLVFNCDSVTNNFNKKCNEQFYTSLQESYSDVDTMKRVIRFKPLTNEHLRKCIEKEMSNRRLDEYQMDHFMKNFNVSLDGCKGVYTKVKSYIAQGRT